MENKANALAAGIFVILLGVAAAAALWWLGQGRDDVAHYLLETRGSVTGLNPQAQVRWRGIRAGKVEGIGTDADDPRIIVVQISLDHRYRPTKATTARLGYQGITGLAYVQLDDDGGNPEPLTSPAGALPRIALKPALFDTLGEQAAGLVDRMGEVSARLAKLLDERNLNNLSRTMANVAAASEGLREAPALMADLREAFSEENRRRLSAILAHVEKTAGETAPLTAEIREMVKSMTALSRRFEHLAEEVEKTNGKLGDATLPRAHALMEEMTTSSRRFSCFMKILEERPQALIFGKGDSSPAVCRERAP